jgi:hypothetical protein
MKNFLSIMFLITVAVGFLLLVGCNAPPDEPSGTDEEPVVLEEGSVEQPTRGFVDDNGSPVYNEADERESSHNPDLAPIFPGAQKINVPGESNEYRESYITRAPYMDIEQYYHEFLMYVEPEPDGEDVLEYNVNSIESQDNDGSRQTALWVNSGDGPHGGLKVMIKEYSGHNAVQIILTTLLDTPLGLNPVGMWVSPEEAEALAEEYKIRQAEIDARRREAENRAADTPAEDETMDDGEDD